MRGTAAHRITMDTSIFEAFPNAVVVGVWQLGICQHGTVVGNQFTKVLDLNVVVDEGASASISTTPEVLRSDLLLYVYPCQLLTKNTNKLVSNYMLYNSEEDAYYEIIDAGIGKNQHTGAIEHVELKVVQTEVVNA